MESWEYLWRRMRRITPAGTLRVLLATAVVFFFFWLVRSAWFALLPFFAGGIIAYVVLPFVNWLDHYIPRALAALLVMLASLAIILFIAFMFGAVVFEQMIRLSRLLSAMNDWPTDLTQVTETWVNLPEPAVKLLNDAGDQAITRLQAALANLPALGLNAIPSIVNTIGFLIGLLALPTWILTALKDQKAGVDIVNRIVPAWMQADFWAIARIIDRPFRQFFSGQVVSSAVFVGLMYISLTLIEWLGLQEFELPILVALTAGLLQLVPVLGPLLGLVSMVLLGLIRSWQVAVLLVGVYLLVGGIIRRFVTPKLDRQMIRIHPVIMTVCVVILSEFGWFWVLVATPLITVAYHLMQYAFGRLAVPPRQAGTIPGEVEWGIAEERLPAGIDINQPTTLVQRRNMALKQSKKLLDGPS